MYLVVSQLKNGQIEIEHGCFNPLADDRATSWIPTREANISKRTKSENIHEIGLKDYLFI